MTVQGEGGPQEEVCDGRTFSRLARTRSSKPCATSASRRGRLRAKERRRRPRRRKQEQGQGQVWKEWLGSGLGGFPIFHSHGHFLARSPALLDHQAAIGCDHVAAGVQRSPLLSGLIRSSAAAAARAHVDSARSRWGARPARREVAAACLVSRVSAWYRRPPPGRPRRSRPRLASRPWPATSSRAAPAGSTRAVSAQALPRRPRRVAPG